MDAEDIRADLELLLRPIDVDEDRSQLVVELTMERVAAIVSPIPDSARPIVLDIAARAYTNPHGVQSETVGPLTRSFGAGGVYVTDQERADLLLLGAVPGSSSGAFTIRPWARLTS